MFSPGLASNLEGIFYKEDQKIIDKYRAMQQMKETKAALAEASGIHDDLILQKLVDLEIRPETLTSLALVPLIEVAWADGVVGEKEKTEVLAAVGQFGWTKESIDYVILEQWLKVKPSPDLLEAWLHYIRAVCTSMNEQEIDHFKTEILSRAKVVAKAEGGFLGLHAVSREEQEMLGELERAFGE
jgi:hypothetical protein